MEQDPEPLEVYHQERTAWARALTRATKVHSFVTSGDARKVRKVHVEALAEDFLLPINRANAINAALDDLWQKPPPGWN